MIKKQRQIRICDWINLKKIIQLRHSSVLLETIHRTIWTLEGNLVMVMRKGGQKEGRMLSILFHLLLKRANTDFFFNVTNSNVLMNKKGGDRGEWGFGVEDQNENRQIIGRCFTYTNTQHTQQMVIEIGWIARFPKVDICILNNDYFIHADCCLLVCCVCGAGNVKRNWLTALFFFLFFCFVYFILQSIGVRFFYSI